LEVLAYGIPVVSTGVGLDGIEARPGEDVLVADSPSDFAEAVIRVLQDRSLRDRLGSQGRDTVEGSYDWEIFGKKLEKVIKTMV
jgi:glycosyltransferase involved in cell wall biosynthesis